MVVTPYIAIFFLFFFFFIHNSESSQLDKVGLDQYTKKKKGSKPENIPNPKVNFLACGRANVSSVCDPDNILSNEDKEIIERQVIYMMFVFNVKGSKSNFSSLTSLLIS